MTPIDWFQSLQQNGGKTPIPPDPPELASCENRENTLIPPETPCDSLSLTIGEKNFSKRQAADENLWFGDEVDECSGGHRGNQDVYRPTDTVSLGVSQGDIEQSEKNDADPVISKPAYREPYFTADGTLVIPFDSDPKYHWWKDGQSVKQTREELLNRTATAEKQ
jgi:hypothetical protein